MQGEQGGGDAATPDRGGGRGSESATEELVAPGGQGARGAPADVEAGSKCGADCGADSATRMADIDENDIILDGLDGDGLSACMLQGIEGLEAPEMPLNLA